MFIKLSRNSFVRLYSNGTIGYITNQLTKHDCAYNEIGADFLKEITRNPREICDCVNHLMQIYENVEKQRIEKDFLQFANSLAKRKFVVLSDNKDNIDELDIDFSYSLENPKTWAYDFTQKTEEQSEYDTQSFLLKQDAQKPRLTSMQFELTDQCNERCIHCYIPSDIKDHGIKMPIQTFKKLINQFADLGGLHVTLSGGEALMHKDIAEILRYCREKDLMITLLTNLTLLKDELIPVLKEVNVSQIQVSLYSMNPETHDLITTVPGSFQKTKKAIEKLHEADIPVQISCPAMKANKCDFVEVAKYAYSMKMRAHCDYNLIAQEDLKTDNLSQRLSIQETEDLLKGIITYNENYQDLIRTVQDDEIKLKDDELPDMPICGVGRNTICVTANGDLFPCAGWQAYKVGNIYKNTLEEIWLNSERLQELRKIKKKTFDKCLHCEANEYCAPCLVTNYNESNGDMFKLSDHVCATAFLNKRLVEEWRKKQTF